MAGHSGQFYTLAVGRQTSKGTAQTTPKFKLRTTGGAVIPDQTIIDLPETDSSIQRSKSAKVGHSIGGANEGMIRADEFGFLAYLHLGANNTTGAGPYTHTATAAAQQPYGTLYPAYDSTALVDRYVDCRITELVARGSGQQALTYSAGWMGLSSTHGETDPGSPAPSTLDPLTYPDVTVTLGGVTTDIVESWELNSTRNAEVIYGDTGMSASEVGTGRWSVTGSLVVLFETDAKHRAWITNSTSGTSPSATIFNEALTILCQRSASNSVQFTMSAVELRRVALAPDPSGNSLRFTYEFAAQPQATIANTLSIVSINSTATY